MRLRARPILLLIVSLPLFAGCLFFAYYTLRLLYVNLTTSNISQHRQPGMYIGAIAFPVISLALGYLGFRGAKAALAHGRLTRTH